MTEVQKEILMAKMLDSPSCLSDDEVDSILRDDEMRDIYEISCAVGGSLRSPEPVLDMDEEWKRFNCRRLRSRRRMRWIVTAAAMLSGIVMVSFLAGMLKQRMSPSDETAAIAEVYLQETVADTLLAVEESYHTAIPAEDNAPSPTVKIKPVKTRRVKHHKEETESEITINDMEIDEYLRIQQAAIDNEIALQYAQVIEEESQLLNPDPEATDGSGIKSENAIKRITVQ